MSDRDNELHVESPADLDDLVARLANAPWLALDTEFLRERTYYARLCLIQVATPTLVACVDPLRLPNLDPLLDVIYDTTKTKVLHSAHQDLEILYFLRDRVPGPVFDTQIAAALLGYPDQIGYATLVEELLGLTLDKTHARTDWSRRPLSSAQLHYAADDVRYLAQIYPMLLQRLAAKGRGNWLQEDFDDLLEPQRYRTEPDEAWRRVSGANQLKPRQRAVLQRLAAWRERRAQQADKPRRWVVSDEALLELSRRAPRSAADAAKLRALPAEMLREHGSELLAEIAAGLSVPQDEWPATGAKLRLSAREEALADAIMATLKACALNGGVSPTSLATRRDAEQIVAGQREHRLFHGWRAAVAGDSVRALLEGKLSLQVHDGKLSTQRVSSTDDSSD